jgi:glycosyltransferase involved in cell wall biosynthesis
LVRFCGFVSPSAVPEFIRSMDVALICRRPTQDSQNSLPIKLFEYMACERPVISTPLNGVREVVGERVLYAADAAEIAQKILLLYHHPELIAQMGQTGRLLVEKRYTWQEIGRQFEEIIISASSETGKGGRLPC